MTVAGKTVIFLGPTLPRTACLPLSDCEIRPPAAMGCITRAVSEGCAAIILVDGVFENGPSVWHKEILWALTCGIPVIGCSSMGAIRAAELHAHGMFGYGEVYKSYVSGALEDDDEVAVVHGPAETGWLALSDAMVDIRAYAYMAVTAGLLGRGEEKRIVEHAKNQHFKLRSFKNSLALLAERDGNVVLLQSAAQWQVNLPCGIKELDCRSLFSNLTEILAAARQALRQTPAFRPTVYLSRLEKFGFSI